MKYHIKYNMTQLYLLKLLEARGQAHYMYLTSAKTVNQFSQLCHIISLVVCLASCLK